MELRDYLRILRKGWPLILGFVVIGAALGILLTVTTTKVYQASVQVFVAASTTQNSADLAQGNLFTQQRVQSYTDIANSPAVTRPVVSKLGLKITPDALAGKISADAPQNKVLINLHVTDTSPRTAARLANAVAAQFNTTVQNTEQTDAAGKPVVKLSVIHPASIPTAPIKPSKIVNIGLGFVLGLLVGIGVVVLRDVLDNTVKGPQDFEELGVPVLGLVPFDKRTPKTPIAFRADPHGARSEAYRQLRTNLQFINIDSSPRVIAVTSGVPGEGKTTTAINLAAALAEGGYRVCLIEADLRRPTISQSLGLVSDVGFTTALIGKVAAADVLQNAGRNLAVLTSGPVPPNPSELLITSQARSIIRDLAETVDFTIIDTAPLLPVADGAEVAAMADATIVVHHAGKSTRDQAARSVEALEKVGERPVGVVLNMLVRQRGAYDYDYGYYYTYRPDKARRASDDSEAATKADTPAAVNGAKEPSLSYAVADLPPTREPVGTNGHASADPDTGPVDYRPTTTLEQPTLGRSEGEQPTLEQPTVGRSEGEAYAGEHEALRDDEYGDPEYSEDADSLFRDDSSDDARPEHSRAERWRELRGRRSRR